MEIELEGVVNWGTAYLFATKKYTPKDVLKLDYVGRDLLYLGSETVIYIIILIIIENADKIFSRCFTSSTKPKEPLCNLIKSRKQN